jgi:hypothetical protein
MSDQSAEKTRRFIPIVLTGVILDNTSTNLPLDET